MSKMIAQLKMQAKINKSIFMYMAIMIGIGIVINLFITVNYIIQGIILKNNISGKIGLSMVITFSMFLLAMIPFSSSVSLPRTLQISVRMGSTRKSFYASSTMFIILCDLAMTSIVCFLLIFEHFLYKLVGLTQFIEVFNIIKFGNLNLNTFITIFLSYFSILLALNGLFYFLAFLGTTIFRGRLAGLIVVIFFSISYVGVMFTPLKIYLENFFIINRGILLYAKFLVLGISGFVLSWPFIEKLDIDRLRFK